MRRFAAISALLLPLPFAALPLLAILIDHDSRVADTAVVVTAPEARPGTADLPGMTTGAADDPLAFTVELGCVGHGNGNATEG